MAVPPPSAIVMELIASRTPGGYAPPGVCVFSHGRLSNGSARFAAIAPTPDMVGLHVCRRVRVGVDKEQPVSSLEVLLLDLTPSCAALKSSFVALLKRKGWENNGRHKLFPKSRDTLH